jgi:hypothetical protein
MAIFQGSFKIPPCDIFIDCTTGCGERGLKIVPVLKPIDNTLAGKLPHNSQGSTK